MKIRLAWNFEIDSTNLFDLQNLYDIDIREELHWEARYFWSPETIIVLHGLDDRFSFLSHYEAKHRQDCYSLLPDANFNIKNRRMQLLYKPLLQEVGQLRAYGKKINLAQYPYNEILPGTKGLHAADLLAELHVKQKTIQVEKDALIYKFPSEPTIKLELARLIISQQVYYSACIEGKSKTLVANLAEHLLGSQISCDYVNFLKQTLTL